MKTVNVIVYIPGYAGNFLSLLFSLDKRTYPWVPFNKTLENEEQRASLYSFSSLQDSSKSWISHHVQFYMTLRHFIQESVIYDTLTWRLHPKEFSEIHKHELAELPDSTKINYLSVHASPDVIKQHVTDFAARNHNFPYIRPEDVVEFDGYVQEYNPFRISLDALFSTDNDFIQEYVRVSEFLGIPTNIDAALTLFHDWRIARETPRNQEAQQQCVDILTYCSSLDKTTLESGGA